MDMTNPLLRAYAVSRILAALVLVVPVAVWALAPTDDEGDFAWTGSVYVAVVAGVLLAAVAARSATWETRIPLAVAGAGWLYILGILLLDEVTTGGQGGISDGPAGLGVLLGIAAATGIATLIPLKSPRPA